MLMLSPLMEMDVRAIRETQIRMQERQNFELADLAEVLTVQRQMAAKLDDMNMKIKDLTAAVGKLKGNGKLTPQQILKEYLQPIGTMALWWVSAAYMLYSSYLTARASGGWSTLLDTLPKPF